MMLRVSSFSVKRKEGSNMSQTAKVVKELQMKVSKLMQEGRLGGPEQDLMEGKFKADASGDKMEECSELEGNTEFDASENFLSGARGGEGIGVRKKGARFSFN